MKPIVFWGASGHAKVLAEFMSDAGFNLVALFDNDPVIPSPFPDLPLYRGEKGFTEWNRQRSTNEDYFGLVAIGGNRGAARLALQNFFRLHGLISPLAIHPTAFVARSVQIGEGSQVLAKAAVCADVVVGRASIINTASGIDHECRLGDGVHIGPGATLSGCVNVGQNSFIGAGAVILPRVTIGANSVIGAGAVVTKDVADNKIVAGNPARVLRDNS
jgi:sugar O-acyltransferase (sialic acid O-acetyltransferase NeuD family)